MAARWLQRLFGSRRKEVTSRTLANFRSCFARYVEVRTFHSNVQHWLHKADEALEIIAVEGVFDNATHPLTHGKRPLTLEEWFSDKDYHYLPSLLWPTLLEKQSSIDEAIHHTTPSTQSYYRRQTIGLNEDLAVLAEALFEVEAKYEQHQRNIK